jgi:chromosome segregation ATPase
VPPNAALEDDLRCAQSELASARAEIARLSVQTVSPTSSLAAGPDVARLEGELSAARSQVEVKSTELASKSAELVKSSEEAARLAAEKAAMEDELTRLRAPMKGGSAEAEKYSEEAKRLAAEVARLEGELSAARSQVEVKSTELASKSAELVKSSEEAARLAAEKAAMEDELARLRAQMKGGSAEAEKYSEEAKRLAAEVARLEGELSAARSQVSDASSALEDEVIELRARVAAREADVAKYKEACTASTTDIAHLEGKIAGLKQAHSTQMAEMTELASKAQVCDMEREQKQDALRKLDDANARVEALQEELEQLQVLRSSGESKVKSAALAAVQDSVAEKDAKIERLLAQVDELRGDLEASRKDREAMVAVQTVSMKDELLRVNTELQASVQHTAALQEQVAALQKEAADFGPVLDEYKRSLDLKESEILDLRKVRDQDHATGSQTLEQVHVSLAAAERRVAAQDTELLLAREELGNLKRRLAEDAHSLNQRVSKVENEKQGAEEALNMERTRSSGLDSNVQQLQDKLEQTLALLGAAQATADKVEVMQERVRAAESQAELAAERLKKVGDLEQQLERKERDLVEERERNDRLRNEMQGRREGGRAAAAEAGSTLAALEKRVEEAEDLRRKAEFALSVSDQEKESLKRKFDEIAEELAEARVRISSIDTRGGSAEAPAHAHAHEDSAPSASSGEHGQRLREAYRERDAARDECRRLQRRVHELQDALDAAGPNALAADADRAAARGALRDAQGEADREREARRALQARLDSVTEELRELRLKEAAPGKQRERGEEHGGGGSGGDNTQLQMRVRSLLRENAECHAQIRLLGAEVVGLSEALEIVTKRAQDGEVKRAQIQSQVEFVTRGVASNRALRPSSGKVSRRRRVLGFPSGRVSRRRRSRSRGSMHL